MQECLSFFKDKTTEISSATPVWNSRALNLTTVNLINNIKPPFVFFSNEKSQIRELFEYYKIEIEIVNSSVTNKTRGKTSKDYFFYKG